MERRSNGKIWSRNKMSDDTGIMKAGMAIIFSSDYSFGQVYIAL